VSRLDDIIIMYAYVIIFKFFRFINFSPSYEITLIVLERDDSPVSYQLAEFGQLGNCL
jgi:hypothetical protein